MIQSLLHAENAPTWTLLGVTSGIISSVVCEIHSAAYCYAIGQNVLYRSEDRGHHWISALDRPVLQVEAPLMTNKVYLLVAGGGSTELWTTTTHGRIFTRVARLSYTNHIVIPQEHPDWIFAFKTTQLDLSKDGGHNWKKMKVPAYYHQDLVVSPFDSNTWYLSSLIPGNHIFESVPILLMTTNAGNTWKLVTRGGDYRCAYHFFADPGRSNRVLAYHCGGIDVLASSGLQPYSHVTNTLQIVAPAHGPMYLMREVNHAKRQVLRSVDRGKTWFALGGDYTRLQNSILTVAATNSDTPLVIGTAGGGIYRCAIEPQECAFSNDGITDISQVHDVVTAGNAAQRVIALVQERFYADTGTIAGSFLYSSTDQGRTWENITLSSKIGDGMRTLVAHSSDRTQILAFPGDLFPTPAREFFMSHDSGLTWTRRSTQFEFNSVTWAEQNPAVLYFWNHFGSDNLLHRTTDGGRTFQEVSFPVKYSNSIVEVIVDPNDLQTLYLSAVDDYRAIVLKTRDGGRTYTRLQPQVRKGFNYLQAWTTLPQRDSFIATDTSGSIYLTTNGARYWKKISEISRSGYSSGTEIYSADNTGTHYFAIVQSHLYESTDGALRWTDITASLPSGSANPFYIQSLSDPRVSPLFAATSAGIFVHKE